MIRTLALVTVAAAAVAVPAEELGLDLESIDLRPRDPRTEARLAGWNAPLGRLSHHLGGEQARLMAGGAVGTPPAAVLGLKVQRGLGLQVVAGTTEAGIERYEQTVRVIRWPWSDDSVAPVLPLDEQLALLLGHRLERD